MGFIYSAAVTYGVVVVELKTLHYVVLTYDP